MLRKSRNRERRATSTVELAILLPFLCFMFAIDYARIFYFALTLENCARNGAYYASNYPNSNYIYNDIYGYRSVSEAVMSDGSNLSGDPNNQPSYLVEYSAAENGPWSTTSTSSTRYVRVTVNWTFYSITNFPGIPATVNLSQSATMRMSPTMPTFN